MDTAKLPLKAPGIFTSGMGGPVTSCLGRGGDQGYNVIFVSFIDRPKKGSLIRCLVSDGIYTG